MKCFEKKKMPSFFTTAGEKKVMGGTKDVEVSKICYVDGGGKRGRKAGKKIEGPSGGIKEGGGQNDPHKPKGTSR